MAVGQPSLVGSTITHTANVLSHGATSWVALFGLIEIAIGVGLLFRRLREAGTDRFVHLGRGHLPLRRGIRHGPHRTDVALDGSARGGLLLHPSRGLGVAQGRQARHRDVHRAGFLCRRPRLCWVARVACSRGPASGCSRQSSGSSPSTARASSITDQLTDTANGEPGWYAHFLNSTGHAFAGTGDLDGRRPGHGLGDHRSRTAPLQASRDLHRTRDRPRVALLGHRPGAGRVAHVRRHRPEQRADHCV